MKNPLQLLEMRLDENRWGPSFATLAGLEIGIRLEATDRALHVWSEQSLQAHVPTHYCNITDSQQ